MEQASLAWPCMLLEILCPARGTGSCSGKWDGLGAEGAGLQGWPCELPLVLSLAADGGVAELQKGWAYTNVLACIFVDK